MLTSEQLAAIVLLIEQWSQEEFSILSRHINQCDKSLSSLLYSGGMELLNHASERTIANKNIGKWMSSNCGADYTHDMEAINRNVAILQHKILNQIRAAIDKSAPTDIDHELLLDLRALIITMTGRWARIHGGMSLGDRSRHIKVINHSKYTNQPMIKHRSI